MEVVGALIIAIIVTSLFFYVLSVRGPWETLWPFFLIILLIVWASSLWITPVGFVYWGIAWVPLFFIGIVVAILLASIPRSKHRYFRGIKGDIVEEEAVEDDVVKPSKRDVEAAGAIGFMFWVFIAMMAMAIIAGYIAGGTVDSPGV